MMSFTHRYYCKYCVRAGDRVEAKSRDEMVGHVQEVHPDARVPSAIGVAVEDS